MLRLKDIKENTPAARLPHPARVKEEFREFILQDDFPCIMARGLFKVDEVELSVHQKLGSKETAQKILSDIKNFIHHYDFEGESFRSYIIIFNDRKYYSEEEYERLIWQQLQHIHDIDPMPWDNTVSADPNNNNFSFSIYGKAFYIVGMHPGSSRMARQSPYPALIFNLHLQFEKLREKGKYQTIRNKIRKRDTALQGSVNPMLEDFGNNSEAKQYSGRAVDNKWKCPFHRKKH